MLLMGHMREGRRTTMKEYEVFKERFRQGLKESGLTPLSFSEKIGVPVTTVNEWVTSLRLPNATDVLKIAQTLGVSADYLLGMTEEGSHEAEKPKVFLSVPMRGRSSEEISEERERLARTAEAFFEEPCDVVDSYFKVDTPEGVFDDKKAIWYLGKALQKMATADVAVFGPRWWDSRGCRIEHNICQLYHIPVLELAFDRNPDDTEG